MGQTFVRSRQAPVDSLIALKKTYAYRAMA